MPNRLASALATCALALVGSAAFAQSAPASAQPAPAKPRASTTVAPVVVEAPAPSKTVELRSYHYVQKNVATGNPELGQLARWREPVCVQVEGLIPNQDKAIEKRIGDVAQAVGLTVPKPGCKANIEIVFSDNPQAVMNTLYKRREYMLGYYHAHEGVRLKKVTQPIQAWHVTATVGESAFGAAISVSGSRGGASSSQIYSEVIDDPENQPPVGCGESRAFTSCLRSVFKNIFIVVDDKFLGNHSLGLVEDYLVMVALADPNSLDGCNELPSVIDLFAKSACPGRDPPDGLTPADASFLTSLYLVDPSQKKRAAQEDIASRMAGILIRANAVAR